MKMIIDIFDLIYNIYGRNYKIVLYIDSLGCTDCRLKLSEWNKIMREADSVFTRKPEFVFFFQTKKKDEKELQFIFRQNGFRHPVFVDKDNKTGKQNSFPSCRISMLPARQGGQGRNRRQSVAQSGHPDTVQKDYHGRERLKKYEL
jgi:hypothetical protein